MLNTLRNTSLKSAGLKAALAAVLLAGSTAASAAAVTVDLCATTGTTTATPIGIPVLGYAAGACAAVTAPGGPVIYAAVGDVVTVNLSSTLTENTGLIFQGQAMVPDTTGTAAGTPKTYTFTPASPGTYLYQAAPIANAEHQVAMGLYGAVVVSATDVAVRTVTADTVLGDANILDALAAATDVGLKVSGAGIPAGAIVASVVPNVSFAMSAPATAAGTGVAIALSKGSAYGATTVYDEQAVLVLSEIDPALNASLTPATFDMRNFAPKYFLINGKAYPDTAPIATVAGHKLLLRYVNAGAKHHSMGVLGLRQSFIAKDGNALPTANVSVAAETLATGQTADAMITVPAVTSANSFALYDANLKLHNSSAPGLGGMLTFVNAGVGAAIAGPTTSAVAITPNVSNGSAPVVLTATITAATGLTVTAAEYFVDAIGANGTGCAVASTGAFSASIPVSGATAPCVDLTTLGSGNHIFYVHGVDSATVPQWGAVASAALNLDKTGPTTSALALTPNPSTGAVAVALSASASDSASGGSNITAASYTIDGGAAVAMTLGGSAAPVRSLTASIPAGLAAGTHTVAVTSQDALGNTGAATPIVLTVTASGPPTSLVAVAPNPNNGTYTISSNQPVVRVTATIGVATGSLVNAAEAFIDVNPAATVRGFPFVATDGAWNSSAESAYSDLPIANISSLSTGNHTIYVRGRDATGTWGPTSSVVLVIERTAPTLASGSLSSNLIVFGTPSVTLTFSANDTGVAGLAGIQYWFDSATAPANPASVNGPSPAIINTSTLGGGVHTMYFRARDTANNVSTTVLTAPLTVVQAVNNNYNVFIQNNAAGTNRVQTFNVTTANGVLTNDLPTGGTRTATPASPTVSRLSGAGPSTMTVSLNSNGSFSYTITVPNTVTGNANIRAAKRGSYQFGYTFTRNGTAANGTVTINLN